MDTYSQRKIRVKPSEPEHLIRKADLDAAVGELSARIRLGTLIKLDKNDSATVQLLNSAEEIDVILVSIGNGNSNKKVGSLVLLIGLAGTTLGIPLGTINNTILQEYANSQTTMDNEFFQRDTNVARLGKSNETNESATLDNAIAEAAQSPKRVQGDAGSVEQHSLRDLIAAERFLQSKKATQSIGLGIRLTKLSPDGTV
ncbi:hypothetical protein FACS1894214_1500 [Planctomycetales bacterium]|nr:hypothetical protein FACS1894214_1500 [Planctomycetales bacterium]